MVLEILLLFRRDLAMMKCNNSGQVQIYELVSGMWTQLGNNISSDSFDDIAGHSISLVKMD
jgi:hypothetical protein